MTKVAHLYRITNLINKKIYIGATTQNPPEKRWTGHKSKSRTNAVKTPLYNAIRKYGEENFIFEVLSSGTNLDEIFESEKIMIKKLRSQDRNIGYNLADGGEISCGYSIPQEARRRMSINHRGEKNYQFGKPLPEETRRKISEKKKGVKISPEQLVKRLDYWSKHDAPLKGVKGKDHPNFGRVRPEDERKRIQSNMPHKKGIVMMDALTGVDIRSFISKKECARYLIDSGISSSVERSIVSTLGRAIKINSVSYGFR